MSTELDVFLGSFKIESEKWNHYYTTCASKVQAKSYPKSLIQPFHSEMGEYLIQKGIFCSIKNDYNWFSSQNNKKKPLKIFWTGAFSCTDTNCQTKLKLVTEEVYFCFIIPIIIFTKSNKFVFSRSLMIDR